MKKDPKTYRILVIEDNPGDFLLIEDYLDEHLLAPDITHAKNFKETQKICLDKAIQDFDVILLDLSLPDKSGITLIEEMTQLPLDCPIVVLTGYSDFDFSIRSLSLGISDYLLKDDLTAFSLYKSIVYNIERKKNLAEIKASEKRYSELFQLSPEPMMVFDSEKLDFLDVNNAALAKYGYSREEFLNLKISQIRPKEELEKFLNALTKALVHKKPGSRGIFVHQSKTGEKFEVNIWGNHIVFDGKNAELILAHDVTERQKHIKAIEQQNLKLKKIAYYESHVLRAPMANIMGLIRLIKESEDFEYNYKEVLQHVLSSAHEMDNIVRKISANAQAVDLNGDHYEQ